MEVEAVSTLCKRCGGTTVIAPQWLGDSPETCPECQGSGQAAVREPEWVWLGWSRQGEEPRVVIEGQGNRRLSLAEAKAVAARLVETAAWGERLWARLKEKGDE